MPFVKQELCQELDSFRGEIQQQSSYSHGAKDDLCIVYKNMGQKLYGPKKLKYL